MGKSCEGMDSRMRSNWYLFFFVFLNTLFSGICFGDRIELRSGRTINGAIVSETTTEYSVKTEIGTLRVAKSDVRQLTREATTAEEVDGDNAVTARNYDLALKNYRTALARAGNDTAAAARLNQKIARISQAHQQTVSATVSVQFQQARQLLANRNYDGAIRILETIRPHMNNDEATSVVLRMIAESYYGKALAARDSQNEIEMEKNLKNAIEAYDPFYKAHLLYGELLLKSSLTEKAGLEAIGRGLGYGGNELTLDERMKYYYMVARKYFDSGDYEKAAENFAECLSGNTNNSMYKDALEMAVKSYVKMGEANVMSDFQKTISNLTTALRHDPANKDAHFLLGRMYKDSGQPGKALEEFLAVAKLDQNYEKVQYYLAQAYRDTEDYEEALKHFELELKNNPYNYDALVDRADVHTRLANYAEAEKDLQNAIKMESSKWRAYLLLAELALAREQYPVAQENLTRVLTLKPDAVEAHVLMGKVLVADKKFDDAKKWFENVVNHLQKARNLSFKYRSLMAEAQTALGEIDLLQESPRQAETRLRQALEYVPNFPRAFNKIGDVKIRLGSEVTDPNGQTDFFKQAETYYDLAIKHNERNPDFYLSLGILYHKNLKDTQKAILNYNEYLRKGGKDVANVSKWIEECGGVPIEVAVTTGTETATTGTETGETAFPAVATGATTSPASPLTVGLPSAAVTTGTLETSGSAVSTGLPPPAVLTTPAAATTTSPI